MAMCDEFQVVGIKKTTSKDGQREYFNFYCVHAFTDYEFENSKCYGMAVELVSANEDFGIHIGDIVEFIYGKAIQTANGVYQPIKGISLVSPAENQKELSCKA